MNIEKEITKTIDIRDEVCPMNMMRTRLALKEIDSGQILQTTLKSDDSLRNVSRSVKEEGHRIINFENRDDETYVLLIEKGK